jgi:hypothetical protein
VIGPRQPAGCRRSVPDAEAMTAAAPAGERAAILQRLRAATEPEGDCWLFVSVDRGRHETRKAPKEDAYTLIRLFGANLKAHRIAYLLSTGLVIPDGLVVRHKCDRRRCCNPDHVEIGTVADNCEDAYSRGRRPRSRAEIPTFSAVGGVIPVEAIPGIVARRESGETFASIAADFGVTRQGVMQLLKRESYRRRANGVRRAA